jgi:hypothetical protein
MLLQIRAGSTLHPFKTTTSGGPPAPLDALCDAHAAKADERKITRTSELRAICDPPKKWTFAVSGNIAIRYFDNNKV